MANPVIDVTQTKTLGVTFKDAGGNVIASGGPVIWTVAPVAALTVGTPADNQSVPLTGAQVNNNVAVTAREPVSGFQGTFLVDVAAVQMLISQAVFVLN